MENKQIKIDRESLRNIRNATLEFIDFCADFTASKCDQDKGCDTNPLSDKQTEFEKILEQQGPFTDPQISPLIDEAQSIVVNLQREIGRQTNPTITEDQRLSIYDERYVLELRLIEIRKLVKSEFDKLIKIKQPIKELEPQESVGVRKDDYSAYETFIRNLRIYYESDDKVNIQKHRGPPATYDYTTIFRDKTTVTLQTFLEILQNPDHTYSVGPAYTYSADGSKNIRTRNKSYEANRDRLRQINAKLIDFFNTHFRVQIPKDFKLYELVPGEKGVYRFKFQIVDELDNSVGETSSRYNHYTQNQLTNEIEKLAVESNKCRKELDYSKKTEAQSSELRYRKDKIDQKLNEAALIALNKKYLTRAEIDKMFAANVDKAEIDKMFAAKEGIYNPYENIEDREPDY